MMISPMLQSYQGPTDSALRSNAVEGYTQVSRIGESVINCFGTQPRLITMRSRIGSIAHTHTLILDDGCIDRS